METFTRKTFQLDLFKNIEIIQIARKVSSFVVKRLKGRRWANKDHNIFDDLQPKWLDTWWLGSFFGRIHNLLVIRRWSGFLTDWWYLGFRCFKRNSYCNHTWRTAHTKVGFHIDNPLADWSIISAFETSSEDIPTQFAMTKDIIMISVIHQHKIS